MNAPAIRRSPDTRHRLPRLTLRRRGAWALLITALSLPTWTVATPNTPFTEGVDEPLTDRLIVHYRTNNSTGRSRALGATTPNALAQMGMRARKSHTNSLGAQVYQLDTPMSRSALATVAAELMTRDANVLWAEPDARAQALATPNDPRYPEQWHYQSGAGGLNLPSAWDIATGQGVVVGVVDTGVLAHEDLSDNLLTGYDFISSASMANDGDGRDGNASDSGDGCSSGHSSWHGTHVAGTIAAVSNNGIGVASVAWNAKILPVRVLGCGGGYTSDIADGMLWAAGVSVSGTTPPNQAAKVLNLSLGGQGSCPSTFQAAINAVRAQGTVVVVAAGNSNADARNFFPANCAGVISVAAVGPRGTRASYSNFGAGVDVAAPGGNMSAGTTAGILSTYNSGGSTPATDNYNYLQGTSMATPHVAGVAALMLGRNPSLKPDEVEVLLKSSARAFPVACAGCGRGIVNATAAVRSVFVSSSQATASAEVEPNDSHAQAQTMAANPGKVSGFISSAADVDTYKVRIAAGATLTARLIANASSDYNLILRNSANAVVLRSERPAGLTDTITWRNAGRTAVDMFVRVIRISGGTGETAGSYTLEVAR